MICVPEINIQFYTLYLVICFLAGSIWLKNTNSPNSTRMVHHYQVGIAVIMSTIMPLGVMFLFGSDFIGNLLVGLIWFLGGTLIIMDYQDVPLIGMKQKTKGKKDEEQENVIIKCKKCIWFKQGDQDEFDNAPCDECSDRPERESYFRLIE